MIFFSLIRCIQLTRRFSLAFVIHFWVSIGGSVIGTAAAADNPPLPQLAEAAVEPSSPASWYGEGVRPTEARSPQEELAGFHVPAGFEVRLFASEPEIAKPMNLAFDQRGRVWVTDSYEYPFPASNPEAARDCVRILEDTDQDGLADQVTIFAQGLNIPIGVLPYGEGCLCFSIPNIYYLRDTNGDGRCDQRDVILGPFDTTRDTHGMVNAMRMGIDGWVYANHGFNNQSTVAGTDGHSITMHSGNTFRFLPDGSRVELVSSGQVNPFGRATDDWGFDFTADCHSKPISQLINGGCYPSFGRPHDGLGFVPPMMDHLHGSTAISGLAYIPQGIGMDLLAGQMLSGNVMTSRLNRNLIVYQGATAKAQPLGDFLTSDDPWFRPVDVRLGPDGFIYVADFYNKIIGHYEVPLDHPGRDRHRGRIWQIRYSAETTGAETELIPPELALPVDWNHPNPTRRELALQEAVRANSDDLERAAAQFILGNESTIQPNALDHAKLSSLAFLAQRKQLEITAVQKLVRDSNPLVRTRTFQIVAGMTPATTFDEHELVELVLVGLEDQDSRVKQSAADLAGHIVWQESSSERWKIMGALLHELDQQDDVDPILRQTLRIAVRRSFPTNHDFVDQSVFEHLPLNANQNQALAEIMPAIDGPGAGTFLLSYFTSAAAAPNKQASNNKSQGEASSLQDELISHMLRNLPSKRLPEGLSLVRHVTAGDKDRELRMLNLALEAVKSGGVQQPQGLLEWAREVAAVELAEAKGLADAKQPLKTDWHAGPAAHWQKQVRKSTDNRELNVSSSILFGESYTGTYQTTAFAVPKIIEFWLAGHNGMPDQTDHQKNRVQLVDATTGEVLRIAFPPRSDVAQNVTWDCQQLNNRLVRIECVDGDNGSAYAWLAIGHLQPSWLEPHADATAVDRMLSLVQRFDLRDQSDGLAELAGKLDYDPARQTAVAASVARLDNRVVLATLLETVWELLPDAPLRKDLVQSAIQAEPCDEFSAAAQLSKMLTAQNQARFAERLSGGLQQIELLIRLIQKGTVSPSVLLEKNLWDRITAAGGERLLLTAENLRATVPPANDDVQKIVDSVANRVSELVYDKKKSEVLFGKHCAVCHQLKGKGQVIGPQLDGIGARGSSRLAEDILLPDRNVDVAFRTTTFLTDTGSVLTGLVRDENDDRIVIAGQDGKEFELAREAIEQRRVGVNSLMPSNFHELMTVAELAGIVRYLAETAGQN